MPTADEVFDRLVMAVIADERCPMNDAFGPSGSQFFGKLARAGRIRVAVYSQNYRVVTILEGAHAGKTTKMLPHHTCEQPYRVIDTRSDGPRVEIPPDQRREPWKPGTPRT